MNLVTPSSLCFYGILVLPQPMASQSESFYVPARRMVGDAVQGLQLLIADYYQGNLPDLARERFLTLTLRCRPK